MLVQLLPDVLGSVLPGPQIDLDEVHGGLEIQILHDVGRRDLVKVAVSEGGKRSDPDILHQLDAVQLAEFLEGKGQILQIRVDALDLFSARRNGIAVVASFGNAAVAVHIVAFVFGFKKLAEFLDLLLHFQKMRDLRDVFLRLEGLDDLALLALIVSVELRTVVGDAAEIFDVLYRIIGRNAHNGAHLVAASLVIRRVALAAHMIVFFQYRIVFVALLLQIHGSGQSGRASADDTDSFI